MEFSEIKLQVFENTGYDDGADGLLEDKDLTESMVGRFVNNRYKKLIAKLAARYPKDHKHKTIPATFYKITGTISTQSTTTLTATASIFNSAMIGDTVYNLTDSASAKILSYTSGTVVTLDESVTWTAGATIYVLGTEFAIGGDAADDLRYVTDIEVKYTATEDLKICSKRQNKETALQSGQEIYSTSSPIWYPTNITVSDVHVKGIGILPEPTLPLSNALMVTYIEMPDNLSDDDDTPDRLPLGSELTLVYYGTFDALKKLRRNDEAQQWLKDAQREERDMIGDYARSTVGAKRGNLRAYRDYDMRRRNI